MRLDEEIVQRSFEENLSSDDNCDIENPKFEQCVNERARGEEEEE